jgi:hypothetical protein
MNEIIKYEKIESRILTIRNEKVILDRDIAELYGVETRDINKAVKNNPDKFPKGYVFTLLDEEKTEVVENFHHLKTLKFSPVNPKAFPERGLYMLATILKSPIATQTTIEIIEAFANLRELNRTLKVLKNSTDEEEQESLIVRTGKALINLFDEELMEVKSDESSMEINFPFIKLKRTVKREKRKKDD